jgi:threonine dehydrogenase-like Zn-dependent dehydrogenase
MRAAVYNGPRSIQIAERPDPLVKEPTDVVVRVVLACVCGSDLWYYRGETPHPVGSIGHEFIGVVEDIGADVTGISERDLVIAPFLYSDGVCPHCQAGVTISCTAGGAFGDGEIDGGQGEAVRVPLAASTLVKVPGSGHSDETLRSLLTLSDVMSTGHHAAVSAGVRPGSVVAVVGDGAVGLSAVLASARLGAARIIALSRNPVRQRLARDFGATDILAERGDAANEAALEMTGGVGVDAVLECVGTGQSVATAFSIARPGSTVGIVGVPHGVEVTFNELFFRPQRRLARWSRPGADLHPRAAPRRARRPHQPWPRLRLRDRPRRDRRRVRGDGRTPCHQVARAGGVSLMPAMSTWTDEELDRVDEAEELQLASARPDGSLRPYVTMWVVRAGNDLYVRSAYGPTNPWYRRAKHSGTGRVRAGGVERDVTFAQAAPGAHAALDDAYHAKYDRYGQKIVGTVVGPDAHAVTFRLVPRAGNATPTRH